MAIAQAIDNPWYDWGWVPKSAAAVRCAPRERGYESSLPASEEATALLALLALVVEDPTSDTPDFPVLNRQVTTNSVFEQHLTAALDFADAAHRFALPTADSTSKLATWLSALAESVDYTAAVKGEIEAFSTLGCDWDGHGAKPISRQAIAHAVRFVQSVPQYASNFEPFPDPIGNVGIEARIRDKTLYLNFASSGEIAYLVKAGSSTHRGRGVNPDMIRELLGMLL